jgi:hypothetical protein
MTIGLTDAQRRTIRDIARVIPIEQHDAFLLELAERLAGVTIGDGSVSRAAVAAMRAHPRWLQMGRDSKLCADRISIRVALGSTSAVSGLRRQRFRPNNCPGRRRGLRFKTRND